MPGGGPAGLFGIVEALRQVQLPPCSLQLCDLSKNEVEFLCDQIPNVDARFFRVPRIENELANSR